MQTPRVLVIVALFLACAPKSADTNGESGAASTGSDGTDATDVTAASATVTPTSGSGPTDPNPTTLPPDTASSAEGSATIATMGPTTTDTSTDSGEQSGGLPGACMAVCQHFDMCEPGSTPVDTCTQSCIAAAEVPSECAMALAAQWNCVTALPCEEALKFLNGEPSSCLGELENADEVCNDVGCGGEISGGDDFCELEQDCGGVKQNYHCDTVANLCTCTENDVAGAECPADGFCGMGPDEQRAAVTACCGWVWK